MITPLLLGISDDLLTTMRIINVGLLTFTSLALYIRFSDLWGGAPRGLKIAFTGVAAYFLTGAYGSAESYLQMVPVGMRILFSSGCCAAVLVGLWMSRREPWFQFDYHRTPKRKEPRDPS